jgi:hypothetical protein
MKTKELTIHSELFEHILGEAEIDKDDVLAIVGVSPAVRRSVTKDIPLGPWFEEPDAILWHDKALDTRFLILRAPGSLHLCGYVGMTEYPPILQMEPDEAPRTVRPVSYISDAFPVSEVSFVPTETDGLRSVVGFDCGQTWDYCPGHHEIEMNKIRRKRTTPDRLANSYRDITYTAHHCRELLKTLKGIPTT